MQEIIKAVAEYCRNNVLQEKWLIAPSLRVGNQWIEVVAKTQGVINLRCMTLRNLALHVFAPQLAASNLRILSGDHAALLMLESFCKLRNEGRLKYLGNVEPTLDLGRLLSADWTRLVEAQQAFDRLARVDFQVPEKHADLCLIEEEFRSLLEARGLISFAEVLVAAADYIESEPCVIDSGLAILLPPNLPRSHAERRLAETLKGRAIPVGVAEVKGESKKKALTAMEPVKASFNWFSAIGEVNEVRQVLRVCSERALKLDEVEIVCCDPDCYVPLIFEELAARAGDEQGLGEKLPCTFSMGVPTRYSRPGRALRAFLAWITGGYPQEGLVAMLREGLLRPPESADEEVTSRSKLAKLLAALPIGRGLGSYEAQIKRAIEVNQKMEYREQGALDEAERKEEQARFEERRKLKNRQFECLFQLVHDLTFGFKELSPGPVALLAAAKHFMESFANRANKFDGFAYRKILEQIFAMENLVKEAKRPLDLDLKDWLLQLGSSARVMGSGPQPGCLHVSGIFDGGASGRQQLFVVGLDDGRFPPAVRQSPLLLNDETKRVTGLNGSDSFRDDAIQRFRQMTGEHTGSVWCSYSSVELDGGGMQFPCFVLLDLYREVSGLPNATQEDFQRVLKPMASFAPTADEQVLSEADFWLYRLTTPERVENARELVSAQFPNLAEGVFATEERRSNRLTAYDGFVPEAGVDLDPLRIGNEYSPSRLEMAGTCPRKLFFHSGLGLRKPEVFEVSPDVWLDPLQFGTLLHKILELYLKTVIDEKSTVDKQVNGDRLREILKQQIEKEKLSNPPPSELAFNTQETELQEAVEIFLDMETEFYRQSGCKPVQVEATFGMEDKLPVGTKIGCTEPIGIPLDAGTIRIKGKIDRVDLLEHEGKFRLFVWDYKSGGAWYYDLKSPFDGGRRIQPYLYCLMVLQQLRNAGHMDCEIVETGYVFPTRGGRKTRLSWTMEELYQGFRAIELLCQVIRSGRFHPTDEQKDCRFCDYQRICGDAKVYTLGVKEKLQQDPDASKPFNELRELA